MLWVSADHTTNMESWLRKAKQVLAELEAESFCKYIDSTPSPFHLVDTTAARLVAHQNA